MAKRKQSNPTGAKSTRRRATINRIAPAKPAPTIKYIGPVLNAVTGKQKKNYRWTSRIAIYGSGFYVDPSTAPPTPPTVNIKSALGFNWNTVDDAQVHLNGTLITQRVALDGNSRPLVTFFQTDNISITVTNPDTQFATLGVDPITGAPLQVAWVQEEDLP
jgi:hypothetical protein